MILRKLRIQPYENHITNCYIICDEETKESMVIDPAGSVKEIVEVLGQLEGNLKYIYLTHCHVDHILGVSELKKELGGKVLIHKDDVQGLKNEKVNMSAYIIDNGIKVDADESLDDNDILNLGNLKFRVIHTPGHTAGGSSLYFEEENLLFSGDTLFRGTYGRTDLPTSSTTAMMKSIVNKLLVLPDETIVYPGHGVQGLIEKERHLYPKV